MDYAGVLVFINSERKYGKLATLKIWQFLEIFDDQIANQLLTLVCNGSWPRIKIHQNVQTCPTFSPYTLLYKDVHVC